MNPIAAILDSLVIYRYSLILVLAGASGVCFFMACCNYVQIPTRRAAAAALAAVILSLFLSRLVYWYGRPDRFSSLIIALTSSSSEAFSLIGVFAGCTLAALSLGRNGDRKKMLDCMSVAGCAAIFLGRLGCFFTKTDRGQIMVKLTELPWAYPVANTSMQPEYRFATFLYQAAAAAVLGCFLTVIFFRKRNRPGDVTILFVLFYCASQMILDSTRYDSLYLRSNGFISLVQVLSAAGLAIVLVLLCIRAIKVLGWKKWMLPIWIALTFSFGGTGYMEYYVQRHGREAAFSYTIMGICLVCMVALGLLLWQLSRTAIKES